MLGENDTHDSSNHAQANQVHDFSCSLIDKTMNTNMKIIARHFDIISWVLVEFSLVTALFNNMQTLNFKRQLTVVFFAAVNHNYDHREQTLEHRNLQSRSKCTNHKSQTMNF